MARYRLYNYDVWGNEHDGFEVNDVYRTSTIVDIPDDANDETIIRILKAEGAIKRNIRFKSIEIDGELEYSLYFTYRPTGRPEFELRRE